MIRAKITLLLALLSPQAMPEEGPFSWSLGTQWVAEEPAPEAVRNLPEGTNVAVYRSSVTGSILATLEGRIAMEPKLLQNSLGGALHGLENSGFRDLSHERWELSGLPGYIVRAGLTEQYALFADERSLNVTASVSVWTDATRAELEEAIGSLAVEPGAYTGIHQWPSGGIDTGSASYQFGKSLGQLVLGIVGTLCLLALLKWFQKRRRGA